ncbi:MAG: transcriptional regulator [Leptolyngbya sp. SIOISBB]|nr:transcriptional regulator [Leptolyngbya sp. SIOISBB]
MQMERAGCGKQAMLVRTINNDSNNNRKYQDGDVSRPVRNTSKATLNKFVRGSEAVSYEIARQFCVYIWPDEWRPEHWYEWLTTEVDKKIETGKPSNTPHSGVVKFIGREPELEQLHAQLQQSGLVAISALEGMGGVGKTELAIQYSQRYASLYEGGICWLHAREFNVGTQIVGFTQSYLNLKIPEGLEFSTQVAFCWRNWEKGNVLLVFDDVVNYRQDVEPYLPPSSSSRFKVLITTRLKFGPPIQSIPLDIFSPSQSLDLLTTFIGEERIQREPDVARTLCKWLGYLPLGIELTGRYLITRDDLSISTLLFRLQEKAKKREAIKHNALQLDEKIGTSTARRGVEAAFDLSWDELDDHSRHLGQLMSLFAQAPIPWNLAEETEKKYCNNTEINKEFDIEEFEDARAKLIDFHLLNISQQEENTYRLHPLIREFFRSKLEA